MTPWTVAARLLCPWDFPGKNTGVGCQSLLQEIFPNQGSNPSSLHCQFSSIQFSNSVVSDSLLPHESQYARPPCPLPTLGVHSNSCPSSWWCHPAISSSVVPFFSCPQFLPASGSFPMSQLFAWGGQSTGVPALASFLPKKSQGWSPSELDYYRILNKQSSLCYPVSPCWLSILNIVVCTCQSQTSNPSLFPSRPLSNHKFIL